MSARIVTHTKGADAMNLAEYRSLPSVQRSLARWKEMSDADRTAYMEAGGADAPINNPPIAEEAAAIDPAVTATIERVKANSKRATTEAPKDAATTAAMDRIAANYKAASGFDLRRKDG
jgi:hypothetical protein